MVRYKDEFKDNIRTITIDDKKFTSDNIYLIDDEIKELDVAFKSFVEEYELKKSYLKRAKKDLSKSRSSMKVDIVEKKFTKEEQEKYSKAIDKIYTSTGVKIF